MQLSGGGCIFLSYRKVFRKYKIRKDIFYMLVEMGLYDEKSSRGN